MQPTLYLHIGVTKTGSTSIQVALDRHRDKLAARGIYVQNRPNVSHSLLPASVVEGASFLPGNGHIMWDGKPPEETLKLFRSQLKSELAELPASTKACIISSEHISDWLLDQQHTQNLSAFLSPYFSEIKVIVYLRRQDQHLASNYNEIIKSGDSLNLIDVLTVENHPRTYDYHALLKRFTSVFGSGAIIPRIFEQDLLHNGSAVDDFFHILGLDIDLANEAKYNQGLSLGAQALLVAARSYLDRHFSSGGWRGSPQWAELVDAALHLLPGRGWSPCIEEARKVMKHYITSNELVRAEYFPSRCSLFTESFQDPPAPLSSESIIDSALTALLHKYGLLEP